MNSEAKNLEDVNVAQASISRYSQVAENVSYS